MAETPGEPSLGVSISEAQLGYGRCIRCGTRLPETETTYCKSCLVGKPTAPTHDPVVLPQHYSQFNIEPIRFGVENYGRGVLVVKVVKYMMRAPFKGNHVQDMQKAVRCLDMLVEFDKGNPDWWKRRL